jgi:hypothetical protein
LRGFIYQDYAERLRAQETEASTSTSCEYKTGLLDAFLCLAASWEVIVDIFADHGVAGVFA